MAQASSQVVSLEEFVTQWQQHMGDPSVPGQSRLARVLQFLRESRTAGVLATLMTLGALVDTALEPRGRPLAERVSMRTLCGGISSVVAIGILGGRKAVILDALRHARRAAVQLDACISAEGKSEAHAVARWCHVVLWRFSTSYSISAVAGIAITMLTDDLTAVNKYMEELGSSVAWWQPWGPRTLHLVKWAVVELMGLSCSIAALYTVLFFEQSMHRLLAVMLREIGRRLQNSQVIDLKLTLKVHADVLGACQLVNKMFGLLLPFYLVLSVGLSLLSTVTLVQHGRNADIFALLVFPVLFVFFVSMCLAGQRVEGASRALIQAAYGRIVNNDVDDFGPTNISLRGNED